MDKIKNDMQLKLTDFFKETLNNLEDKSIKHLKDLEVMKYESCLILNEGIIDF
jgi:hypothetical protein